jgi:hypothetical protein
LIKLDIDKPDEISQSLYKLYGSNPSSENLVAFTTMMLLARLIQKLDRLSEQIANGVGTFPME